MMQRTIDVPGGGIAAKVWVGGLVVIGVIALATILGSGYNVDQSERAVVLRMGALSSVEGAGFHTKIPFADTVHTISIRNKLWRVDKPQEGYSHDQQSAHYIISVNYQVNGVKASDAYVQYGGVDGLVSTLLVPNVLKLSKVVIGQYTAQTSVQERGKLNDSITFALQEEIKESPLIVTAVNVEEIVFGADYMKSINDRMVAEVKVQTQRQNLENEKVLAQILVTQAQGKADSTLAQAKADALAIEVKGKAEATSIQVQAAALGQNPNLINLEQARKWNGILPSTMIPGGSIPMLNLTPTPERRVDAR